MDKNHAYNPKTGQNFVRNSSGCWIDSKTGKQVNTIPGGSLYEDEGHLHSGYEGVMDKNHAFNPKTGQNFVRVPCPPPSKPNQIFFGFSLIREDSKPKAFNTYGVAIDFSHFINQHIALTADFGINFGSSEGVDYTKKIVLVGAVADILNKHDQQERDRDEREQRKSLNYMTNVSLDVRACLGVTSITSKAGPYKFTSNLFTADLGIGAGFPLNKKGSFGLGLNIDYIPTFSGGVKNNVRASAGLRFGFRSKNVPKVKTDRTIKRQRIY